MKNRFLFWALLFYASAYSQTTKIPLPTYSGRWITKVVPLQPANIWAGYNAVINSANYQVSRKSDLGVAHYDGVSWTHYKNHSATVSYEYMTDMAVTPTGKVWIGALNGLFYLNPDDSSTNKHFNSSNSSLANDSVLCVTVVNSKVWLVTRQGVSVYDGTSFTNYPASAHPVLANNRISKVVPGLSGEVFMASPKGLIRFKNNSFALLDSSNSVLRSNNITALYADKNNNIWIGTAYANDNLTLYVYNQSLSLIVPDKCNSLRGTITSIAADTKGNIAISGRERTGSRPSLMFYTSSTNTIYPSLTVSHILSSDGNNLYFYVDKAFDAPKDTLYMADPELLIHQSAEGLNAINSTIDANNISMPVLTGGDFGWSLAYSGENTQAPKGSCKSNLFAGALWLGAMVDNNVHLAAQTYRQNGNDYFPGPINKGYPASREASAKQYSRFWKIEKKTIEQFKADFARGQGFTIPEPILSWPAHGDTSIGQSKNMAPFIDVNNDGRYNPYNGDYPDIKGDMSVFWVMNDANNIHSETGSIPLGFEIHGMAYSYVCTDIQTGNENEAVNNTVFLQYRIVNRSDRNYAGVKPALWIDIDNGNYNDDYVGCNPKVGYAYGYNGDAFDEGGLGYGAFPPGTAVLPMGNDSTRSSLSNFHYYNNDFDLSGNPSRPEHYWNYLNSKFKDGWQVTYGGNGRNEGSTDYTSFMYPGKDDPNGRAEWSESSVFNQPGDRRFVACAAPFNLDINADTTITYAIIYSRSNDSAAYPNPILNKLEHDVVKVKGWFARNEFPNCSKVTSGLNDHKKAGEMGLNLFPNPAGNKLTIQHDNRSVTSLKVYDLSGKLVRSMDHVQQTETLDISDVKPGFYIIKVEAGGAAKSIKFIKL